MTKWGVVSLDGEKVSDLGAVYPEADLNEKVLRVGKKMFVKLVARP